MRAARNLQAAKLRLDLIYVFSSPLLVTAALSYTL
jgi:hypothetical protein